MRPKAFFYFFAMPVCPIYKKPNVTMFHVLGHGAKGKAKKISDAERQARRLRMAQARKSRWLQSKKK